MLSALSLTILVHIGGTGNTIDTPDIVGRLEVGLLYLQFHQSSGESHHTDVMTGIGLHCNNIALLEVEIIDIVIISLTGMLKLHLDEVGGVGVAWHVGQPVVGVQLLVLSAHRPMA